MERQKWKSSKNGCGGKIAKIDGVCYWVGSEPVSESDGGRVRIFLFYFIPFPIVLIILVHKLGNIIYLYKKSSSSLGSNSWEFVRKLDLVADGLDSRK